MVSNKLFDFTARTIIMIIYQNLHSCKLTAGHRVAALLAACRWGFA